MKIRAIPALITATFLCAAALPVNSHAAGRISAIVVYASGDVKIQRGGETTWFPAKASELLYTGDSMETGPLSYASIALKFGSEVRLNENSILRIIPGNISADRLALDIGQVWTRLLQPRGRLEIGTPSAICAVRGTEADIEHRAGLTVKVYEGHVELSNSAGRRSLAAGQMSMVAGPGEAPAAPTRMKAPDFGTWQESVRVKNMRRYLDKLAAASGEKKVKLQITKDGKTKDLDIKVKKK